jgi:hypothetical protein
VRGSYRKFVALGNEHPGIVKLLPPPPPQSRGTSHQSGELHCPLLGLPSIFLTFRVRASILA